MLDRRAPTPLTRCSRSRSPCARAAGRARRRARRRRCARSPARWRSPCRSPGGAAHPLAIVARVRGGLRAAGGCSAASVFEGAPPLARRARRRRGRLLLARRVRAGPRGDGSGSRPASRGCGRPSCSPATSTSRASCSPAGLVGLAPWLAGRVTALAQRSAPSRWSAPRASEERQRIARELHDVVAHGVVLMVLQAQGARRILDQDPARAREALEAIEETGQTALAEIRALARDPARRERARRRSRRSRGSTTSARWSTRCAGPGSRSTCASRATRGRSRTASTAPPTGSSRRR